MPDASLRPPFSIHWNEDSYWIEDASGIRWGYVYYRDDPVVGSTLPRPSRRLAELTVKWIAREATKAARK